MKRLFSYINKKRKEAILAPLLKMLEASFELLIPLIVADMIDRGINGHDSHRILLSGGLMILLGLIGFGVSLIAQYFAAKCAVHTGTAIRSDLFHHINQLSYADLDKLGTATLITRMTSDINQVQNGVNMFLRLLLRSPFVVLGAMVMAFTVDVKSAFIFTVVIPVLLVIVFGILLGTRPLYRKVQAQLDTVTLKTRENLQGVRVVRAFNRQTRETDEFSAACDLLYKKQILVGKISAILNPLTTCVINLAIVFLLFEGGRGVNIGRLSQGQVIALVNYMSQILVELVKLANLIILLSKAAASMNRVDAVFRMEPSVKDMTTGCMEHPFADQETPDAVQKDSGAENANTAAPYLSFDKVSFHYGASEVPVLDQISFNVHKGQTIGIIGATGSGKSSLVNLIPRFYDCNAGSIRYRGKDLKSYPLDTLRSKVGLVPQKAFLFKGTLRSNLLMGNPDASDDDLYNALEIAQAKEFVDSKQKGLDLLVEPEGRNFSGGQKQRLTIARALVRKPEILILDDSASALDFATDAKLRAAIRKYSAETLASSASFTTPEASSSDQAVSGTAQEMNDSIHANTSTTVFLVSQRVSTVRDADQILCLEDGQLSGIGDHYSLLKTCSVYREICESQMTREEILKDLGGVTV